MALIVVTIFAVLITSLIDLKTNKIPNWITLPTIVLGIIFNFYYSGLNGLEISMFGFLLGIGLLIIPFSLGGMGAGDVKLLAALGALNGTDFVFNTFLYSAVAGGLMALVLVVAKGKLKFMVYNILLSIPNFSINSIKQKQIPMLAMSSGIRFPYGLAFLVGTLCTYWVGW